MTEREQRGTDSFPTEDGGGGGDLYVAGPGVPATIFPIFPGMRPEKWRNRTKKNIPARNKKKPRILKK